jgi:hypothetical protein
MVLLLATIIAAATPAQPARPLGTTAQARATIRIISGVELHLNKMPASSGFIVHDSVVRSADSEVQPAKLVEFQ